MGTMTREEILKKRVGKMYFDNNAILTRECLDAMETYALQMIAEKDKRIEELEKSHKELLQIAKHYIKNWDFEPIANADKLILPDKPKDK